VPSISFLWLARYGGFFAVTGLVFPFVYGANEIMASSAASRSHFPALIVGGYLQLLVTTFADRAAL